MLFIQDVVLEIYNVLAYKEIVYMCMEPKMPLGAEFYSDKGKLHVQSYLYNDGGFLEDLALAKHGVYGEANGNGDDDEYDEARSNGEDDDLEKMLAEVERKTLNRAMRKFDVTTVIRG